MSLTLACKGGNDRKLSDKEREQLTECTKSISAITDADGDMRIMFLAEGCGEALGFREILTADASMKAQLLAKNTDYACNKKVAEKIGNAEPERRSALLIESCGANYYGLTSGASHHLSMSWFLGQRSAAWIADAMSRAGDKDKPLVAAMKQAMSGFDAPLPVPAEVPGLYALPQSLSPDMVYASKYLLVDSESIKVVERARLRLTEAGAQLDDPLAHAEVVALNDLHKHLQDDPTETSKLKEGSGDEDVDRQGTGIKMARPGESKSVRPTGQYSFKNNEVDPEMARKMAVENARRAGVLGILAGSQNERVGEPREWAPLLVADKSLSAMRVLAIVDSLGESGAYLGAKYMDVGMRSMVAFGRRPSKEAPLPELRAQVLLRDDALEVWLQGRKVELARNADGGYPYDELQERLTVDGNVEGLALLVSATGSKATFQELVHVLDAASEASVRLAITGPGGNELVPRYQQGGPPVLEVGDVSAEGDLDKEIIRTYIRRKLPRIRHCYEKELLISPTLAGTVTTIFQVSPTGSVQGVRAEGLGNRNVEDCIASSVRSIQFPKPNGGGIVNVRYPFTLQPAQDR